LYKRQTTIPFTRIQHVDVRQGVLERSYDLGKLNIYTAGGQGSDLSIPGLRFDEAQRLKAFILGKVTEDEEE
ncbi:MAG: PH domain-containing protein, partial [Saprospiraceae bacterium]|nr:PH domain-containing protein [Saprospiraceae bacterium]